MLIYKKHSMKISEKEVKDFLNSDYLLEYGYFSFKRENRKRINEGDEILEMLLAEHFDAENDDALLNGKVAHNDDTDDIYQVTASDMFSKELWSTENVCQFYNTEKQNIDFSAAYVTVPIETSGKKSEYTKRKFKFINFYNYIQIITIIEENIEKFTEVFCQDENSTSKFLLGSYTQNEIRRKKDIKSKDKRYILKMDLSNFYPSIYTHTIPWLGMGKKEAKKNHKNGFYNNLDKIIQNSQHGETKGIPTGSISSKLIAEFYLLKIDEQINDKLKEENVHFHRYVDDYHFYYNHQSEKEKILTVVYGVFSEYELYVNDSKVIDTKFPNKDSHTLEISSYFDQYYGYTSEILRDELTDESMKANKIVKIIYNFIDYFTSLDKEKGIKMPPYFAIQNYLDTVKNINSDVYTELLKKDLLFELMGLFLLEMKYLQYFVNFIEKNFMVTNEKNVKSTFEKYQEILCAKLKYYIDHSFEVEVSHLLTLNLLFPYFHIEDEILLEIIVKGNSFIALMAFKILYQKNKQSAVNASMDRMSCFSNKVKGYTNEQTFTFTNENFLFEYEIGRMYKHDKDYKSHMCSCDQRTFTEKLKIRKSSKGSEISIEKFYKTMIKHDIKIFLK